MSDQDENILRYDRMVEQALRGVVRQAVEEIVSYGALPGEHHFYITFMTDYAGVRIPDYLKDRYPGEMTIVLQHQFDSLHVKDDVLCVTLSFNNVLEKLEIPLSAVTIFADPSVNFALQFQPISEDLDGPEPDGGGTKPEDKADKEKTGKDDQKGEVISLDQFRKK